MKNQARSYVVMATAVGSLTGTGETFRLVIINTSSTPWTEAEVSPN